MSSKKILKNGLKYHNSDVFLVGAGARKIPCAHTGACACMNFVPIPELVFWNLQYHNNPPGINQHQHSKHGYGQAISFA
jgi:hypothetical protein